MSAQTPSTEELLSALQERLRELEECHKQILALRLEASVRTAFVIELQNQVEAALDRARQFEAEANDLRARVALAEMEKMDALSVNREAMNEEVTHAAMRAARLRGAPLPVRE